MWPKPHLTLFFFPFFVVKTVVSCDFRLNQSHPIALYDQDTGSKEPGSRTDHLSTAQRAISHLNSITTRYHHCLSSSSFLTHPNPCQPKQHCDRSLQVLALCFAPLQRHVPHTLHVKGHRRRSVPQALRLCGPQLRVGRRAQPAGESAQGSAPTPGAEDAHLHTIAWSSLSPFQSWEFPIIYSCSIQ